MLSDFQSFAFRTGLRDAGGNVQEAGIMTGLQTTSQAGKWKD